jgi:hypothetical protein
VQGVGDLLLPGRVVPASLVLGLLDEGDIRVALDGGDAAQGERVVGLGRGRRAVPVEPGGVQVLVAHPAGQDDLEGAMAEFHVGASLWLACGFGQASGLPPLVVEQTIETVALPVEVFLQGEHAAAEFASGDAGGFEQPGERRGVTPAVLCPSL